MKTGICLSLATLVGLVGVAVLVPPAMGRSCGTVTGAPGYHAYSTQATGTSCRRAKRVVGHWLDNRARPRTGPRGWHCRSRFNRQLWRCTRQGAVIRFTFHRS